MVFEGGRKKRDVGEKRYLRNRMSRDYKGEGLQWGGQWTEELASGREVGFVGERCWGGGAN